MATAPLPTSYSRVSNAEMVDLPLPLEPTSARVRPAGTSSVSPRSTGASARVGYAKWTSRSCTVPTMGEA